jgi:hypothetical protein
MEEDHCVRIEGQFGLKREVHSGCICIRVAPCGEELGYVGGGKPGLAKSNGCPEAGTTGANNNGVVFMIDNAI